jgi:hypothetical protein
MVSDRREPEIEERIMIYIVEIPHQRPASCWVATSDMDYLDKVAATVMQHRSDETVETLDQADEYLSSDLSGFWRFNSAAEAIEALEDATFDCHGGAGARDALENKLALYGELPE